MYSANEMLMNWSEPMLRIRSLMREINEHAERKEYLAALEKLKQVGDARIELREMLEAIYAKAKP